MSTAATHEALAEAASLTGRFIALMSTTLGRTAVPRKPLLCGEPVRPVEDAAALSLDGTDAQEPQRPAGYPCLRRTAPHLGDPLV